MLLAPYLTELLAEHLVTGEAPAMLRQFLPDRFLPTGEDAAETDYYSRYTPGAASSSTTFPRLPGIDDDVVREHDLEAGT